MSKGLIAVFTLLVLVTLACGDKTISDNLPTDGNNSQDSTIDINQFVFRGVYHGEYTRINNFAIAPDTGFQHIEWTFSDAKFWCEAIDTVSFPRFVCDFSGFYTVSNQINFNDVYILPGCNGVDKTNGDFQIWIKANQNGTDSVFMMQHNNATNTRKIIRLEKML